MKTLRNLIVALLVVVIVVVVGAYIYLLTIDVEDYHPEIAEAVADATGRELTLGGPLDLAISLTPVVVAENVSFANADWGSRPQMATIERIEVQIALLPLISSEVEVLKLVVSGADILLETDAEGRANWEFEEKAAASPEDRAGGPDDDGVGALIMPQSVLIENATLTMRDGETGEVRLIQLDRLTAEAASTAAPLALSLQGTVDSLPIQTTAELGAITALTSGGAPYPVAVEGTAGGLAFKLGGTIAEPMAGSGLDIAIEASADDLAGLAALAGDGLPTGQPFALSGKFGGGPETFTITDYSVSLGTNTVTGQVTVATAAEPPRIEATLASDRLDLAALMPAEAEAGGGADETPAADSAPPGRVFPNQPLGLDGLKDGNLKLGLTIGELITPSLTANDVSLSLTLENGRLSITPASLTVAGSPVAVSALVDARQDPPAVGIGVDAPQFDLGRFLTESETTDLLEGTADIVIDLEGRGASIAAIMGSLNGEARVLMGDGRARTQAFDMIMGGLTTVMGTLFSGQQEWTVINCIASDFLVEGRIATSRAMILDSEHSTVISEGSVDLGAETLALKVTPSPKVAPSTSPCPSTLAGHWPNRPFGPTGWRLHARSADCWEVRSFRPQPCSASASSAAAPTTRASKSPPAKRRKGHRRARSMRSPKGSAMRSAEPAREPQARSRASAMPSRN